MKHNAQLRTNCLVNYYQLQRVALLKVFLSWSGDISHKLALALHAWIPAVLQNVKPFVSSTDIDSGARWSNDIGRELETTSFGILCITKESVAAPWLNFEAGALSKAMDEARVVPLLLGLKKSDIRGPLVQFNMRTVDRAEIRNVIDTLNSACVENAIESARLDQYFEMWWPKLEEKLESLRVSTHSAQTSTALVSQESSGAILEELLDLARSQQKMMSSPGMILPPEYVRDVLGVAARRYEINPAAIDDITIALADIREVALILKDDQQKTVDASIIRIERAISYISRKMGQSPYYRRRRVMPPSNSEPDVAP